MSLNSEKWLQRANGHHLINGESTNFRADTCLRHNDKMVRRLNPRQRLLCRNFRTADSAGSIQLSVIFHLNLVRKSKRSFTEESCVAANEKIVLRLSKIQI